MSTTDIVQILLAILYLTLGLLLFRYANRIKRTREEHAKYSCYGGLILFINAGVFVYVSNWEISLGISVVLMIACIGCVIYKRK